MKTKLTLFVTLLLTALIAITLVQLNSSDKANPATVVINAKETSDKSENNKKVANEDFASNNPVQPTPNDTASSNQDPALPNNVDAWKQHIKAGNTVEDLLAATLLTNATAKEKEDYLLRAYTLDPANSLINFKILETCLDDPTLTICSLPYLSTLIDNGMSDPITLFSIAAAYYQNGDISRARQFIEQASKAESEYLHSIATIKALDQSATKFGLDRSLSLLLNYENQAFQSAKGTASHIHQICLEQNTMSVTNWRLSCTSAIRNIGNDVSDFFKMSIAYGKYFAPFGLTEDDFGAKYTENKRRYIEQLELRYLLQQQVYNKYGKDAKLSSELWQAYLDVYEERGGDQAKQFLLEKLLED